GSKPSSERSRKTYLRIVGVRSRDYDESPQPPRIECERQTQGARSTAPLTPDFVLQPPATGTLNWSTRTPRGEVSMMVASAWSPPGASPTDPVLTIRTSATLRSNGTWLPPHTIRSPGSSPRRANCSSSVISKLMGDRKSVV